MTTPILGDLSLTTEDGTVLSARTDVGLAQQWAEHTLGSAWTSLTYSQQTAHVSEALAELRRTHAEDNSVTTWPHHHRDDGTWCRWSGVEHRTPDTRCPAGCDASREHYANDGHPECDEGQ
jgi:hypothetical protein